MYELCLAFRQMKILNIIYTILTIFALVAIFYMINHEAGTTTAMAIVLLLIWGLFSASKQKEIDEKYEAILYDEEQLKKLRKL